MFIEFDVRFPEKWVDEVRSFEKQVVLELFLLLGESSIAKELPALWELFSLSAKHLSFSRSLSNSLSFCLNRRSLSLKTSKESIMDGT